jgi:hypothetical protein
MSSTPQPPRYEGNVMLAAEFRETVSPVFASPVLRRLLPASSLLHA